MTCYRLHRRPNRPVRGRNQDGSTQARVSMNAVVLKEYFTLAMDLQILWNCKYFGTELVLGRMRSVVERLNAFDLPHSRKLVPKLERMRKILDERHFKEFEQF